MVDLPGPDPKKEPGSKVTLCALSVPTPPVVGSAQAQVVAECVEHLALTVPGPVPRLMGCSCSHPTEATEMSASGRRQTPAGGGSPARPS